MNLKGDALQIMKDEHLCVLSTVGPDGRPQSAVVGFSEDDQARLVVGTSKKSRKYHNITRDPRVSVVIGWDNRKTIQYEGLAREAQDQEKKWAQELRLAKNPNGAKYKNRPDETYLLIEPTWVRYTDTSTTPWEVQELKEFA